MTVKDIYDLAEILRIVCQYACVLKMAVPGSYHSHSGSICSIRPDKVTSQFH